MQQYKQPAQILNGQNFNTSSFCENLINDKKFNNNNRQHPYPNRNDNKNQLNQKIFRFEKVNKNNDNNFDNRSKSFTKLNIFFQFILTLFKTRTIIRHQQ
jgi:hypothetical protein